MNKNGGGRGKKKEGNFRRSGGGSRSVRRKACAEGSGAGRSGPGEGTNQQPQQHNKPHGLAQNRP